jgi:hypothetical protein
LTIATIRRKAVRFGHVSDRLANTGFVLDAENGIVYDRHMEVLNRPGSEVCSQKFRLLNAGLPLQASLNTI